MKKNQSTYTFLASFLILLSMTACTTISHTINKERYLSEFIGQSSQYIQKNINFSELGMSENTQVTELQNKLIYNLQRPMSIPIPMGHKTLDSRISNQNEYYDVKLNCQIIFQLNAQQIAESVRYTGRAC